MAPLGAASPAWSEDGEEDDREPADREGDERVRVRVEQRFQHEPGEHGRPRPEQEHRAPVPVAHLQEPVVEVRLVRRREPRAPGCPAHDGEGHVEDRDTEDHERDQQRREEEVGVAGGVRGAPTHDGGRSGHEQPEEERAGIAHEDASGVEVVRQEADADPAGDRRDEGTDRVRREQPEMFELDAVDTERAGRDRDGAGGEAVEAVDQVDRIGHPDHPEHRHERGDRRGEHEDLVGERHLEEVHGDARVVEDHRREDHPGDLCRRGHLPEVVDHPDEVDHHTGEDDPERLRGATELACEQP